MRVACVVGGFPELTETFILDQMTALLDHGHELIVLARPPGNPNAPLPPPVTDYRLMEKVVVWDSRRGGRGAMVRRTAGLLASHPLQTVADVSRAIGAFGSGDNLLRLWSRVTALRTLPPVDLLLAQFGTNGVLAEQARRVTGLTTPLAVTFLGHDLSSLLKEQPPDYYARLFATGELMLPLSGYFRDRLISLGCPAERITVQHLGVDAAKFSYRPRRLGQGEALKVTSVARMVEKKGLETGLRAFETLRARRPGATWHLIGDGPLRPPLERLRRELGLEAAVTFHGSLPRERVRELLDQSHLFLAPSVTAANGDQEGTPVAIMEAMAVGLPVVSTRHSGIPELVQDGVNGYLVPERNGAALAEALDRLAGQPSQWEAMGRAGREVIEREYDTRILGGRLCQLLEACGARRR